MPARVICLKYTIKDVLKGWSYKGIYKFGETSADNNDSEEDIKRKTMSIIIKKNLILTHSLYLIITLGSSRAIGVIPFDKSYAKADKGTFKINVANHLGLAHYVVATSSFVLENLDVALYDKNDFPELS